MYGLQAARAGSWEGIAGRRTAACGVALVPGYDGVELRAKTQSDGGQVAYAAGVQSCGAVWGCPCCNAKVRTVRAQEVKEGAQAHVAAGGALLMLTLTVRHRRTDPLADLVTGLRESWRRIQQHRCWRPLRADLLGTITTMEVTMGPNGWHPHLHLLLFVRDGAMGELLAGELSGWLPAAWKSAVGRELSVSPDLLHGCHVTTLDADAAAYVAKIADETARADLKADARQPWALIDQLDGLEDGDADAHRALAQWTEYLAGTQGRSTVRWSRGLRDALGIGAEEATEADAVSADEAIATSEAGGDLMELLDHRTWLKLDRARDENGVRLSIRRLEAIENARRLADELGVLDEWLSEKRGLVPGGIGAGEP